jgi:hypothetical protein
MSIRTNIRVGYQGEQRANMLSRACITQNVNGLHSRLKQWIDRFKGVATKYLDNYLAWFLFVDSRSNASTKHHIKEFLLTSFVYEMTDTYESFRLSKPNV